MSAARAVRLRFSKLGKLRWISHRDVARLWERALRRAEVPVAYSTGFSPHPKLSFGLALPTGAESHAEYLDVDLDEGFGWEIGPRIGPVLPDGVAVVGELDLEAGESSLQEAVVASTWEISLPHPAHEAVESLVAAESVFVTRERKGQPVHDDIRPAVLTLSAHTGPDGRGGLVRCDLATKPRGLRPSELLTALGVDPFEARVLRTHQWIERDGAWHEPVPAPGAPARREACLVRRDPVLDGTRVGSDDSRRRAGARGADQPGPTGPGVGGTSDPPGVPLGSVRA